MLVLEMKAIFVNNKKMVEAGVQSKSKIKYRMKQCGHQDGK
jgi:isocitrate lyase